MTVYEILPYVILQYLLHGFNHAFDGKIIFRDGQ